MYWRWGLCEDGFAPARRHSNNRTTTPFHARLRGSRKLAFPQALVRPLAFLIFTGIAGLLTSCSISHAGVSVPGTSQAMATTTTTAGAAISPSTCGVVIAPGVTVTVSPSEPCSATTQVGVTVRIVLDHGMRWENPTSNSPTIQVGRVHVSPGGVLTADLHAATPGQATVTAMGWDVCVPHRVCLPLGMQWSLPITVGLARPERTAPR